MGQVKSAVWQGGEVHVTVQGRRGAALQVDWGSVTSRFVTQEHMVGLALIGRKFSLKITTYVKK